MNVQLIFCTVEWGRGGGGGLEGASAKESNTSENLLKDVSKGSSKLQLKERIKGGKEVFFILARQRRKGKQAVL